MLLLKNCTAVEFDPPKVTSGVDILIDGNKIAEVGRDLVGKHPSAQVKNMGGKLVMPGMVCAHNHFYSGLSRGVLAPIAPCPDFISTLKNLWWRLDRALDEESLYYSGLICSLEAVRNGCTAVIDHHASPAFIKNSLTLLREGFITAGLRGMTCFETTDRNDGVKELEAGVEENINFARLIDKEKEASPESWLVEAHIGAHAPFTVPDVGLELLRDAVHSTGRGLHIHVAEDRYDVSHSRDKYGMEPLARLDKYNLLNDKALIAHGLWLSAQDVALLNERNGFLVHNARSNMNNAVGYNPHLPELKHVALGTDGIGSDMFEEFKFAYFKHRDAGGPLWPGDFLKMLAQGNALLERNFHGLRFGKLEQGYTADITICDYAAPTPLCAENLGGHIAFGMSSASVHSVIVAGRMIYENREFAFDTSRFYAEASKAAERMWRKMAEL
ncbi:MULTISPECIES: putative aminohydrolase SsnA [Tenebrionibacter/Tenebrionicola group]|jgi:putative selenium metabolism protein SsnA|uniref:Putative aminohydrolase SsnA n=1 Tax=Tenebrionibacter intestinalis TaxID=2799638 RepID=A0A8K0V3A3_9ENTR|nr:MULTISPECIES: putative aminohydrolase SsnA [Tenebrionibacter/Tenebrionicola group]MBK4714831.1 putative aminohydrolase SsnA [Tenebrionibacter intestinalis]MBV4414070.1 putative aminohydrolase SsnA [Tenebrionicola larvae]